MAATSPGRRVGRAFDAFATKASHATGRPAAFFLAAVVVFGWLLSGPLFGFTEGWPLLINSFTTIATFLMVFLIQHTQSKDTLALQLKVNELLAAQRGASNRLIDIEDLGDDELEALHQRFRRLARDSSRLEARAATSVERGGGPETRPRTRRARKAR